MTALLDRMEEKNLVRRQVDEHDRRSVRVFLTPAGRQLEPQIQGVIDTLERLLGDSITPEQMETFHYVLCVLQNIPMPDVS